MIRMAKQPAAEACCPACEERIPLVSVKPAPASGACCPACDERAPLASVKPPPASEACCPACEAKAGLTASPLAQEGPGPSLKRLALASGLALASEIGHFLGLPEYLTIALAAAAILIGGIPTWIAGWRSVFRLKLDIMALMSVAVTGAVLIGEFSEGALVLVLFALAEKLEERSVDRARRAIASLLTLAPEKAFVDDGQGGLSEAQAADIPAGARVRVRPGEKLALDGVVVSGASAIDQSPITGESAPVTKLPGDQVFAGTLNISGTLDYEVTVPYGDSALSRIVKTVEAAEGAKAPVERFVERFARVYTPAVFALAIVAAVLPPLAFGGDWRSWIYRALALLVISCPCALVVSTPVAVLSALASATRRGLLVKGGVYLEEGRRLKVVALDKTGTLTSGKPSRTSLAPLGGYDPKEADRLSASLASLSNHPVSQAVAKASAFKGGELAARAAVTDRPGLGVAAGLGGRRLALGSRQLMRELGLLDDSLAAGIDRLEAAGETVVVFADEGRAAAVIAVADTVTEESQKAVAELRALGVKTVMLTGDNEAAAAAVAAKVGLDGYRASLMPEDKLAVIEELGREGKVGMAGDGINDAPALARADIGFSMGAAGAGAAIETADVAIMDDNLAKIPLFIRLSRAVHRILTHNIVFILLVKLTFIVVTLMGRTDMWMAVLADIGVTLIVVANSLRLSRHA
jgi:Cd2+/Zn2+-exporting ATPase